MRKTKKEQVELDKEITQINAGLESPKLTFTIADLKEDPSEFETELVDFLRRHSGDEINLTGKQGIFHSLGGPSQQKMNFSAKLKWSLASFETIAANGKYTVTVKVPIE